MNPPSKGPKQLCDQDFSTGIKLSLALHFIMILAIFAKFVVFPGKPIALPPTLRVDIVGLPDILKKDLHALPSISSQDPLREKLKQIEADAKQIRVKPLQKFQNPAEEMALKPKLREKKIKNALARIKALSKLTQEEDSPSSVLMKGNKLSRGTSLSTDAIESEKANYYDLVRDKLKENWTLPIWIARQELSAQVQIFIDAQGRLTGFHFVKTSGNEQFDEAIKRDLRESQPFPMPPKDIVSTTLNHGILVGFPL